MFNPGKDAVFLTDFYGDGNLRSTTIAGRRAQPGGQAYVLGHRVLLRRQLGQVLPPGFVHLRQVEGQHRRRREVRHRPGRHQRHAGLRLHRADGRHVRLPAERSSPRLKLFGNYEITDEWSVGANLLVQSGRPINCLGVPRPRSGPHPRHAAERRIRSTAHPYGSSFMRCNERRPRPRGTAGRLPWTTTRHERRLGARRSSKACSSRWTCSTCSTRARSPRSAKSPKTPATGAPLETYLLPTSFQAPRSVRFMVQYDF